MGTPRRVHGQRILPYAARETVLWRICFETALAPTWDPRACTRLRPIDARGGQQGHLGGIGNAAVVSHRVLLAAPTTLAVWVGISSQTIRGRPRAVCSYSLGNL